MKVDLEKKQTKFATRTLKAFSYALREELESKPLETISIRELCEKTDYPRATFYNYFDDIYDLLRYCFQRLFRRSI